MDCRCFYHRYHYYKSHAWCDWSLEVVGFRAELTFGAFTYVNVCIGNFLCACEKSQGWQFFVFIVKFAIFCKPANIWIHCSFLLFSLFCIKFMRIVKNRKGDDFSLLCSLLCCSSSWKPDMDFTNFAKNLKVNDFLTWQNFHFLLQILQFLQLRANLDMSSFCRCQNKVGNCMVC